MMKESNHCPGKSDWKSFADSPDGFDAKTLAVFEAHLSSCGACRDSLDRILSGDGEGDSFIGLADWQKERETFIGKIRTAELVKVYGEKAQSSLDEFSFIESVSGSEVTGTIGGLELRSVIGSGAMGVVFRAFDPELEREVAVKTLWPEFAKKEAIASLFLDEARAVAALHHENVVPVFQVARGEGQLASFVMPLIRGGTLADELTGGAKFSEEEIVSIGLKISGALTAAHEAGILHRDVKPGNILLEGDEGGGLWLADFGLARAAFHGFGEGNVVGTPRYAAPEILEGKEGSEKADLYSFGVILQELLASAEGVVSPRLGELAESLTMGDPEQRPDSAAEVLALFQRENSALSRGGRKKTSKLSLFTLGLLSLMILSVGADTFSGKRVANSLIQKITTEPITVDGQWGSFDSLTSALSGTGRDVTIRITGEKKLEVDSALNTSGRKIRLLGSEESNTILQMSNRDGGACWIVNDGSLSASRIDFRFLTKGNRDQFGMIEVTNGEIFMNECSLRRLNSSGDDVQGPGLVVLKGSNRAVFHHCQFVAERDGRGFAVFAPASSLNHIEIKDSKVAAGNVLHIVRSSNFRQGGDTRFEIVIEDSILFSATPFRFGRGMAGSDIHLRSHRNLYQCSDAFFVFRSSYGDFLQETLRFSDDGSIVSAGSGKAVRVSDDPVPLRESAVRDEPLDSLADWKVFRKEYPGEMNENLQWVSWIADFVPGRKTKWNAELDLSKWEHLDIE